MSCALTASAVAFHNTKTLSCSTVIRTCRNFHHENMCARKHVQYMVCSPFVYRGLNVLFCVGISTTCCVVIMYTIYHFRHYALSPASSFVINIVYSYLMGSLLYDYIYAVIGNVQLCRYIVFKSSVHQRHSCHGRTLWNWGCISSNYEGTKASTIVVIDFSFRDSCFQL